MNPKLRNLLFMALCCDLGIFSKKLIAPAANMLTELLRIPGGVSAGFSLMFLVIGAELVGAFGCATLMGAVQSIIAVCLGTTGSMGALAPLGYILPGLVIDLVLYFLRKGKPILRMAAANALAGVTASLTANCIVFRLRGGLLLLYLGVSAVSGLLFGLLGCECAKKLRPLFRRKAREAKDEG